jgi:hypothetical protein
MKRSLLAVAALLCATPINAEDLKVSGNWRAFRNVLASGQPVCGMSSNKDRDSGSFSLKYFYGNNVLTGQVIKFSWQFPPEGTTPALEIPLTVGVDRNPILSGNAIGYTQTVKWTDGKNYELPTLEFYVKPEKVSIDQFLDDLSLANRLWLRFDEGSEKPWVMDMTGSAAVAMVFKACALELIRISKAGDPPATQPYGKSKPTQPYGNSSTTQPYGSAPAKPSQPFGGAKAAPAKPVRKDDGSV